MDSTANGQNNRQEKCPARQKCHDPMQATKMFRTNAVGLMISGANPNNPITAM